MTLHDEVAGQVVGQTVSGRDISAYVLGDADDTTAEGFAEAAVLVNGAIHAREWQTPEAVTGLFEALVEARSDAGFGQYLIENLTTVLVPVNNVDGFLQTQLYPDGATADRAQPREGRMRRKNLRNAVHNLFRHLSRTELDELVNRLELDPQGRAECLSADQFVQAVNRLPGDLGPGVTAAS